MWIFFSVNKWKIIRFVDILILQYLAFPHIGILYALYTHLLDGSTCKKFQHKIEKNFKITKSYIFVD